jgi:hypothetical protein
VCIGQWLVLDKVADEVQLQEPRPLTAKCKLRRCSESDVYWPRDGFCHDEETARRERLCASANTVLAIDEYGDGFCKCVDGGKVPYVRVVSSGNDDNYSQPCYPVYSKGPCPRDHVLTPYGDMWVQWLLWYYSRYWRLIWIFYFISYSRYAFTISAYYQCRI